MKLGMWLYTLTRGSWLSLHRHSNECCPATCSLSNFDKLCQEHSIPIDTDEDEAEGTLPAILRFRKHLQGASTGIVVKGPGRPKGAATPGTKTKGGMPKAQLAFTPSGECPHTCVYVPSIEAAVRQSRFGAHFRVWTIRYTDVFPAVRSFSL